MITAGHHDTRFGGVIHPPLDDMLWTTLARGEEFSVQHRRLWRRTKWTQLDSHGYATIIRSLHAEGLNTPAFWMLERYWEPA